MAELILTTGPLAGQRIRVEREIVIGREGVDLTIDDPELSRRHVAVRPLSGGVEVEDLGSKNGTRVDGAAITAPVILSRDARLEIGATVVEISLGAAGETRASAVPARAEETVARVAPAAAPAPATAAMPSAAAPAFGGYAATGSGPRRGAATRIPLATALTVAVIIAVAIALVAYFAAR